MIDRDALNVWYEQRLVGRLWRDDTDRMGFRYDTDWLDRGFRLSVRLPLTDAPFRPEERAAHFFFANLLPEGDARNRLLRARRLPDSDFILLREFGGDCAGALSILPAESAPESAAGHIALSDDMLHRLVLQRGSSAYADDVPEPRPRLSLAGAQDKCPVYLHEGRYHLPQGTAASTHILKFRVPGFANVPLYEAFMCRLAHSVGLAVPETRLADIRGERFLVVTRYDRFRDSERFESEYGTAPALQRIGTVVRKQCRRILHPRNQGDGPRPAPE